MKGITFSARLRSFVAFAGDANAAGGLATGIRTEALKKLSTLNGLLPVEETTEARKKKKVSKKAVKKKTTKKHATLSRKKGRKK